MEETLAKMEAEEQPLGDSPDEIEQKGLRELTKTNLRWTIDVLEGRALRIRSLIENAWGGA